MIDALVVKPKDEGDPEIVRTRIPSTDEEGTVEPEYEGLKKEIGGWIEHVEVDPGVHVWCDEEFRLKSLKPSAIIVGSNGAVWDFGGPLVITGPDAEGLLTWAVAHLTIPHPEYRLSPGTMRIITEDADGNEEVVFEQTFDPEETPAKREAKRIGRLMDSVGPPPRKEGA